MGRRETVSDVRSYRHEAADMAPALIRRGWLSVVWLVDQFFLGHVNRSYKTIPSGKAFKVNRAESVRRG